MCLRHWLIIGALGSLLAGCESLSGPSRYETRVQGYVFDTAFRPLPGTRVEILDGPRAGASMSTGAGGAFEFGGSARGAVRLRASRDGFESATIATVWEPDSGGISVYLKSLEPTLPITPGPYALTVTSHPSATGSGGVSCTGFPADLLSRTYEAVIEPNSGMPANDHAFLVRLTGPTLFSSARFQSGFAFGVAGQFVGFEIDGFSWPIENLSGFRYLTIMGNAPTSEPATSTETSITIPFQGEFGYCHLKSDRGGANDCSQVPAELIIEYHRCASRQDTMVFTKR